MVEVREVKTKKEQKEFIEFPLKLYKGNPYFVPPLYGDEKKLFDTENVYCDQAESVFYNAYRDGKIVGRIHGILQYAANEKWGQKRVRFTRFDSIDDEEVSRALFDKLTEWAKAKGMEELVGPLGFSDLEREGLLIEGFDQLSTFEEQYNYDYYQKLIEAYGFEKEIDWNEFKLSLPDEMDERIPKVCEMLMKKYKLHYGKAKNTKEFIEKYGDGIFELLDITYADLYGTVPFTQSMKDMLIANFKLIIDIKYVAIILDENERPVCFGLGFPSIAKAVQKSGGRLTLPTLIKVLNSLKKPEVLDMALIGVLPEYARKGISVSLIAGAMNIMKNCNIKYAETNLILENNYSSRNQFKRFNKVLHKRRRSFVKSI